MMTYRGDADRVHELSREARHLGDETGFPLMSAGMRNYAGGAYLNQGDVESALKELRDGERILVAGGEQMMLGWNLQLQASVALMQGRLDDAAFLHSRQVDIARELGHRRVLAVGLTGLGQVQIQRGEWGAADRTLCESLDLFERMGLATEIGYVTVLLAKVIAQNGESERSAEAASCVRSDPSSDRPYLFQTITTAEMATGLLDELSGTMEA
jgi:ATP/maltotriose-dependent transcriptional regulator MalT